MTGQPAAPLITPFRAVLLDDNADDREHLRFLLRRHPSIQLIGEAGTFKGAMEILAREPADVLFLETKIGNKSLLDECPLIPPAVKLIFLTRYPAAAVRAFELDAVDFLLKPFTSQRFSETTRRLLCIDWQRPSQTPPVSPSGNTILIPFERGRRGVSLDEISLIQAFGNYTRVSLDSGRTEIVLRSLAKWEKLVPFPPFLRVHRNTIVHSQKVRELEDSGSGSLLRMIDGEEAVPVSRRCLPDVRQALFSIGR